jgi:heterodisulfide reductase subunit B
LVKTEAGPRAYTFFPGCLAQLKLPQVERSVRSVLGALGIDLHDEPRFTCCPDPVVFRSGSRRDWLLLASRNLTLDNEAPIVTLCPGCASSLAEARHVLTEDEDARRSVEERLGRRDRPFRIPHVGHFLSLLIRDDILRDLEKAVRARFEGLRVAAHYGCHLVRPSVAVGFDDPEKPTSIDTLVELTGARSVEYEDKYMCCGRPSMDEAVSTGIAAHKLEAMERAGCDLLVLACPFCFEQFDLGQVVLGRKTGREFRIPVLYVTQLLGIAMGMRPDEMGLDLHRIKLKKEL